MPHSNVNQNNNNNVDVPSNQLKSQSQLSTVARAAIMSSTAAVNSSEKHHPLTLTTSNYVSPPQLPLTPLSPQAAIVAKTSQMPTVNGYSDRRSNEKSFLASGLNMTPVTSPSSTAPTSPRIPPIRSNSGTTTPRVRPPATTLNIPGLTRSRVSPDGRIAQRDVASKLVIIMVGLPARGKSYITKKIKRYLAWQQHDVRIFNVGNRRRVAAAKAPTTNGHSSRSQSHDFGNSENFTDISSENAKATEAAHILLNGSAPPIISIDQFGVTDHSHDPDHMDQSADFFDPTNTEASNIRENLALSTLDELLDYLLLEGGAVGILDATNSTIKRRNHVFERIKEREPKLGILFIESICEDKNLLEANMRLKLSGPDYKDKDPVSSLEDFKKRVAAYESAYQPIGKFEEDKHMQYIQMIDVGRKVIHYQLKGFLSGGIASYLTTFNLAPRQIWITRHGKSVDNVFGKIGGNSDLTPEGQIYGQTLHKFITQKRKDWKVEQEQRMCQASFPPHPGENTPPYPDLGELEEKNFCVWTSMLKRSFQTAEHFESDDDYDVKNWEMLNELNSGSFEGLTYNEIEQKYPIEFARRKQNKLQYIYPGVGGEGYLQVISRLREMIREIERITDHVLIIGHRSVARVLMAYFLDLTRDDIAGLDVPLGMLYVLEPRPYGVDFHAYKYNAKELWFDEQVGYKPQKETSPNN